MFNRSWHGRTIATLSATGNESVKKGFKPLLSGFIKCEFNNIESVKKSINKYNISAIMLETIQGEGGIRVADKKFLKELRNITMKKDILLIIDEVQTGLGRTGKMLASDYEKVRADILILGKAFRRSQRLIIMFWTISLAPS